MLHSVINSVNTGKIPSKVKWKEFINETIQDYMFAMWRFELCLFSKLSLFRVIVTRLEPIYWWVMVRNNPYLKKPCVTLVRLLCGTSVLAQHANVNVPRNERVCQLCNSNSIEDIFHFVMECPFFDINRLILFRIIEQNISDVSKHVWRQLGMYMKLYVIMGMDYPLIPEEDIGIIRFHSCLTIHQMYKARRLYEPP